MKPQGITRESVVKFGLIKSGSASDACFFASSPDFVGGLRLEFSREKVAGNARAMVAWHSTAHRPAKNIFLGWTGSIWKRPLIRI